MNNLYRFLRCAVLTTAIMTWMMPAVAQTPPSPGLYYIANYHDVNPHYNPSTIATNYYLVPASTCGGENVSGDKWALREGSSPSYTYNPDKPLLTTYHTNKDNPHSLDCEPDFNSIWEISTEVVDNVTYYRFKHWRTGKYIVYNTPYPSNRRAFHLESANNPSSFNGTDLFEISFVNNSNGTGVNSYNIRYKNSTSDYQFMNPAKGNKDSYYGTIWSNEYFGGLIGIFNEGNNDGSKWHFEPATVTIAQPTITFNNTTNTVTMACANADATIYYTIDGGTQYAYNGTGGTGSFVQNTPAVISAIASFNGVSSIDSTYNLQKVATPTFSLNTNNNVLTFTSTEGASIYYSIGAENTPAVGVNSYTDPFEFPYDQTNQPLNAIAVKEGWINSEEMEPQIIKLSCYKPTISFDNDTQQVTLSCNDTEATIYYTTNGDTPVPNQLGTTEYSGTPLDVTAGEVIKAIAVHEPIYNTSNVAELTIAQVATPTIQDNGSNAITITSTTEGATIYYTTDGSEPTTSSTEYTGPLTEGVSGVTIKAIAVKENMIPSAVGSGSVTLQCAKPVIVRDSDGFTISCTFPNSGVTIYYTTDGSTPTTSSSSVASGGSVPSPLSVTVKAMAVASNYNNSDVTTKYIEGNDYPRNYLTFNVLTAGTISWKYGSGIAKTISYRINGGSWTLITDDSNTISVVKDDVIEFKGSNITYATSSSNYSGFEGGTATYDISGNIMSLVYSDDFVDQTTMSGTYNFCSLFKQSKAVSAENLILPATSLTKHCYRAMFSKSSLEVAPALPATTLGEYCYYYIFENCKITTAPELPAPTLVSNCYGNMFTGCTSLNYIKCLAEDNLTSGYQTNWVNNVAATGTFVKDVNAMWETGASGIPSGWEIEIAELVVPVITCDGEFITITCQTNGADIHYRLGQTGSYSLYSAPIAIHENTVVEAYAEKNELRSDTVSQNCTAIKTYKFAGMQITPGPLYYGSNGYEIKEGWNDVSYNSAYGKTVGSTYFNFIELGQLFESSVFSTSDGDIEKVLDPLDGWRVPTNAEWASIIGTTRSGSTVNGSSNKHYYAMIQLTGVSGLLVFPDGEMITGTTLSNLDNTTSNTITASQLDEYLSQGCIFLPGSGYYDGTWNNGHYYWSSSENDSSTGYDLCFEPSGTISSVDSKDKGTCYFPVYLVKDAADEATRLLRTWTYNGNEVEVPYSVNAIDGHSSSYAKGTFTFTTNVKIKELQPTYLWFQHADQSAAVYVDNTLVEKHWGGYNAFFVDITNHVHVGTNNIKVVIKNNEGSNLAPCAGDFNFNATLGEVKLISSPVVPAPDYGYDGFHITSTVTAQEATITVKTSVPTNATLTCSIKGTNCDYTNTQTGSGVITFTHTITNPRLWNGTLDPYLYDVTLTIAKDGVVYHKFKRGYGLRFYEYVVDNAVPENSRFMLNGSPYFLRGVCMHHDLEGKANALTVEDMDNDFEILKELGCNFVRLAHYPHPKEVYDHCDKMGIIVQTEVPWVNNANTTTQPDAYYEHLEDQYRDMVNQHYNHPCIMFWGLSNETTTEKNSESKDIIKAKIENYKSIIKGLDPERWVGYVMSHGVENPSGYYNDPNVDWFGCNIYVGWYLDPNSNNPTGRLDTRLNNTLTRLHKPLAFSEYGCGGTQHCHSDHTEISTTKGNYARHDIEYQMWLHEGHIAAIKRKPQLLFTSQWQLFDIAVSGRNEGYTECPDGLAFSTNDDLRFLNNKGLVERDHVTKKDPFYLYKAWWNTEDKFVHICGKDYGKISHRVIKCYTNDGIITNNDTILRLFVNNVVIDTAKVVDNIATFAARDFNPGQVIRVEGATTEGATTFDTFTIPNGIVYDHIFQTAGDWNEADKWSTNTVPTAGSNVLILADATISSSDVALANVVFVDSDGSLTIEEGGQLIHNNEGTLATVQKTIAARSTVNEVNKGWAFIASPLATNVAPTSVINMTGTFDLYRFNQKATLEWENYLVHNTTKDPFLLVNGQGYLYNNVSTKTLGFVGAIKPSNTVSVPIKSIAGNEFAGWNLVGNPFTCNAVVDRPYYKMNEDGSAILATEQTSGTIAPCTGIMVKATEADQNVTFTKVPPTTSPSNGNVNITVVQTNERGASSTTIDNAIVSFSKGSELPKFYFGNTHAQLYIPQDNKEFAIVAAEDQDELPLNFRAFENGQYTISVHPENVEMNYLHLIDNMTGADVDLLTSPSYTFTAKTTDYESRFRLVFASSICEDANGDNEAFAFFSNGDIIVNGEGMLQVIDMTGRVIVSRMGDAINRVSTNGMTPGMYVLRLINGDNLKTQKIVIP